MTQFLQNRYQIIKELSRGGMGAVYKAKDMRFQDKYVAIKQMNTIGLSTTEFQMAIQAFKQEANILGRLLHQNLPRVYDYFEETGNWYLIMDFIEGNTLEAILEDLLKQSKKLPIKQVLTIAINLCEVLQFLHNHQPPIIFRDLKPSNIMLTSLGHLYLIDFGIARFFKSGQIKDTQAFGSPGYAAPEQYGRAQTSAKSDIYSLGVILHELLVDSNYQPPSTPFMFHSPLMETDDVSIKLNNLILQMVQIDPQKRASDAQEILRQLNIIQSNIISIRQNPLAQKNINPLAQKNINPLAQKNINPLAQKNINPLAQKNINLLAQKNKSSLLLDAAKLYQNQNIMTTRLITEMAVYNDMGNSFLNKRFGDDIEKIKQIIELFELKVWYRGGVRKYIETTTKKGSVFQSDNIELQLYKMINHILITISDTKTERNITLITKVNTTEQKMSLQAINATATEAIVWIQYLIALNENNQIQFKEATRSISESNQNN